MTRSAPPCPISGRWRSKRSWISTSRRHAWPCGEVPCHDDIIIEGGRTLRGDRISDASLSIADA